MKIRFDNGTPNPIARSLRGHEITFARKIGWHELKNGELIQKAEEAGYEILLSTDKNIRYQQNLAGRTTVNACTRKLYRGRVPFK